MFDIRYYTYFNELFNLFRADAAVQKIRSIINTKFKENMENKTEDGEKIEWTEKEK